MPKWDDGITRWDDGSRWGPDPATPDPGPFLTSENPINLNSKTHMQPWEITKERAQATLTVWSQHAPTLTIGGKTVADLEALIDDFEGLAQNRVAKQDASDAAHRAVESSLLKMHVLGARIPAVIEGQFDDEADVVRDLRDVYRVKQSGPNRILQRARHLHPVWVRANTALAALTPAQPPITRAIQGVSHTAPMYLALVEGITDLTQARSDAKGEYDSAQEALDDHEEECDRLIKRWYKVAKATFEPGTAAYAALESIPKEPDTPAPDPIEISTVVQGGEDGLQALVHYVAGGGDHATTRLVKWKVEGVDPDFIHETPLDPSGNALGPFAVGQVVQIQTLVSNSSGSRTSAVRTITIEEPIG